LKIKIIYKYLRYKLINSVIILIIDY
jgi:hypothetical protein